MNAVNGDIIEAAFRGPFGRFTLDARFTTPARGVTALFGPSGCGKTSVLRCMAGLARVPAGRCVIAGEVWQDDKLFRPTHHRPIGYVFQEASLFAHLSVKQNLLYGAPADTPKHAAAGTGFDEVTALLGLRRLLDRSPQHLSGGERQRVAIGRALLSQPKLLLMDEPLSALDRTTKDEILPFLERLHGTLSLPVIYVSHDMAEVERLADRLVLMESGRVTAAGPLSELQSDPALPLAKMRGAAVSVSASIEAYDAHYGLLTLSVPGGRFILPGAPGRVGEIRRVRIFASDVSIALEPPRASTILNTIPARILSRTPADAQEPAQELVVVLALGAQADGNGTRLLSRVTRRSWDTLGLAEGQAVHAQIKSVALGPGSASATLSDGSAAS